jgi:carboxymethylenebutenolidase
MSQEFHIGNGTFNGYLALPSKSTQCGVIVFHAWWGLNNFMTNICDRVAESGFVTLAPDYYGGEIANTIDEAKDLRKNLDRKNTNKLVAAASDFLGNQSKFQIEKIGAIGFSLGASFAIEAARRRSEIIKAVVLFYGSGGGKFDKTNASFLGHFAENDGWGAHSKKIKALAERIESANQKVQFFTYPNTKHWFFETDRPEYDQNASEKAWERTIAFLKDKLS